MLDAVFRSIQIICRVPIRQLGWCGNDIKRRYYSQTKNPTGGARDNYFVSKKLPSLVEITLSWEQQIQPSDLPGRGKY